MKLKKIALSIIAILVSYFSEAQIHLSDLFSDGMVMQQKIDHAIWGTGTPGHIVQVLPSWTTKKYSTTIDKDGNWRIKVATPEASYQQHAIHIKSKNSITLNNVLIGEVWLCSGQSNMALPLKGAPNQGIEGSLDAIIDSKNEYIRYFGVAERSVIQTEKEVRGIWQTASPSTSGGFSAVGYFFAKKLQKSLDIPVAILVSAWGGSRIEAWMSTESLAPFKNIEIPTREEDNKVKMQTPTVLFNGMINGLIGYGIKGVLWYQGESNRDIYKQYPALFQTMHKDWVHRWEIGEFPIYFAEIAPFEYKDTAPSSALIREAQLRIANTQPHTAMIALSDVGDSLCIHPPKKRPVGERFAYTALAKLYGMDYLDYQFPQFSSMEVKNDKAILAFDAPMGITFNENERTGFEIAGTDQVFYPAQIIFDVHSDRVLALYNDKVPNPIAVRYGWRDYFKPTLFGANGIPVPSFRTDTWEQLKN